MQSIDKLYRTSDLEPYIGCKRAKVYELISAGKLSAVKIGRGTFIAESEIKRFRNENMRPLEVAPAKARQSAIA